MEGGSDQGLYNEFKSILIQILIQWAYRCLWGGFIASAGAVAGGDDDENSIKIHI